MQKKFSRNNTPILNSLSHLPSTMSYLFFLLIFLHESVGIAAYPRTLSRLYFSFFIQEQQLPSGIWKLELEFRVEPWKLQNMTKAFLNFSTVALPENFSLLGSHSNNNTTTAVIRRSNSSSNGVSFDILPFLRNVLESYPETSGERVRVQFSSFTSSPLHLPPSPPPFIKVDFGPDEQVPDIAQLFLIMSRRRGRHY